MEILRPVSFIEAIIQTRTQPNETHFDKLVSFLISIDCYAPHCICESDIRITNAIWALNDPMLGGGRWKVSKELSGVDINKDKTAIAIVTHKL